MSDFLSRNELVHDLFVRTADENYITARWCYENQLRLDFSWLAVHCLEKYMKAVLLLNGHSAKENGHDVRQLFVKVSEFANDLLPERLEKPIYLRDNWFHTTTSSFIDHIYRQGNADNRYLIYGYTTRFQDLFMLDMLVFAIRRLARPLNERYLPGYIPCDQTNRDWLLNKLNWKVSLNLPLEKALRLPIASERKRALFNHNYPFAPIDYVHEPMAAGSQSRTPVILRRVLEPLASSDSKVLKEAIKTAKWLLENVVLPGGGNDNKRKLLAGEIEEAIKSAELKLNDQ